MKIKKLIGKGVRGYIDFDINFRESVTFLIGINGSGKTTALKLLSALLEPSYKMLCSIDFLELALLCEVEDNKTVRILCKKDKNRMLLSYEDNNTRIQEEAFEVSEMVQTNEEQRELAREEYIRNRSIFENSKVVALIKSLQTPLFLGINRRVIEMNLGERIVRDGSPVRDFQMRRRRGMIDDAVDRALFDIQNLVFDYVRHNAKRQATYADNFRKKVVHDSFKFYDSLPQSINNDYDNQLMILEKKHENIKVAIQELGLDELTDEVDNLFNQLEILIKDLSKQSAQKDVNLDYYNTLGKWMVNSTQLEKIDAITQYGNEYLENLNKLREPINRLQGGVNVFFKEGGKELIVDGQGEIKVKISPQRVNSIYELSSGEKQLVVMLAHLALNKGSRQHSVFFIDEPELSLHISWQELFVDALLNASPQTQFIIATHAPAILAKPERKEWCEDLSR
jgi:predicted ATP-binding protein involved in virulence